MYGVCRGSHPLDAVLAQQQRRQLLGDSSQRRRCLTFACSAQCSGCHAIDGTETIYETETIGLANRADSAGRLYEMNKCRRQLYYSIQQHWFCGAITGSFMTYISLLRGCLLQQKRASDNFNTTICMPCATTELHRD